MERQSTCADKDNTNGLNLADITGTRNFLLLTYISSSGHSLHVVHSPLPITITKFKYKPVLHQPALKCFDISFTFSIHFHSLLIRICLHVANYKSTLYLIMLIHTIIWTDFPFYLPAPRLKPHVLSPMLEQARPQSFLFLPYYVWVEFMLLSESPSDIHLW